jgi:hypothetical protein
MRIRSKLLLTALTASLVFAVMVSSSSARRFALSNQLFRVTWSSLEFTGREPFGGTLRIRCPVTLEGSFHSRTLSKVSGQLIGYVTRAALTRPCNGGEAWILNGIERPTNTLPWHIRYDRFIGTLPAIERIRLQLINASFLVLIGGSIGCLFESTAARPAFGFVEREAGGLANTLSADPTSQIPLKASLETIFCPSEGSFEGSGNVTLLGNTTRISVTLVQ